MASGGTFTTYNKVLPGAYINFVSKVRASSSLGERGIVALPLKLSWGKTEQIININVEDFQKKATELLGYHYLDHNLKPLREVFKFAKDVKLFRLGSGDKATVTLNDLTVTAKCEGVRGNSFAVKIVENLDNTFNIITLLENTEVYFETATNIDDLKASENPYLTFDGEGDLMSTAGLHLAGGTDNVVTNAEYTKFLELAEAESFNVLLCDSTDDTVKGLFESFTKRLRDDEGVKFVTVLHDYSKADYEGIISAKNEPEFLYWIAGATAGASVNESLTNKVYNGEYTTSQKFTTTELKNSVQAGGFVLYDDGQSLRVLKDINSFTSFENNKNSDFSHNQVIRVLDSIANDIAGVFNNQFLGKQQNDATGRDIFKSEIINYVQTLQSLGAVENFSADDVAVKKGTEKGNVVVDLSVQPVSAMDKLYMECIIE